MLSWSKLRCKVGGATNSSFLALIPKETNPSNFSRFRPISLCNSSYKILTKIIVNSLKGILPRIISENQGGFLQKRKNLDNILLVKEAVHSSKLRKESGMEIKLDMPNMFDRVHYSFLFAIMKKFGFSNTFISWISAFIKGPLIETLVNGRPWDFFQSSRGLRQGWPLSPLLYVIMVDSLIIKLEA
jgi:hypothetical protein